VNVADNRDPHRMFRAIARSRCIFGRGVAGALITALFPDCARPAPTVQRLVASCAELSDARFSRL